MYNYNNYPYMGGGYLSSQSQYNSSQNGLKGRPVSSLEEARASQIDFDGSLFVFPDIVNKRIYTKQFALDGVISFKIYEQIEEPSTQPSYITKEEFTSKLEQLEEKMLKEIKDGKQKPSTSSNNAAIAF